MSANWWMVRAGRGGVLAQEFESKKCVAYAGELVADISQFRDRDSLAQHLRERLSGRKDGQLRMSIGQCARFVLDMSENDRVVTYDADQRAYMIGVVKSACRPGEVGDLRHVRDVQWIGTVPRDSLTMAAKNSLGSIMSVFSINQDIAKELEGRLKGEAIGGLETASEDELTEIDELRLEAEERGRRFIEDQVAALDWEQMQELVAGVLRAMGFRTRVSAPGPDQGRDIVASPDGLGLSQPRIVVEVKHRINQPTDAVKLRSFLGGRRPGDNGMYVSTGGFTKDAKYEAERANIPIALVTLQELVDLLIQHYTNADTETRALVPLLPVYWPA